MSEFNRNTPLTESEMMKKLRRYAEIECIVFQMYLAHHSKDKVMAYKSVNTLFDDESYFQEMKNLYEIADLYEYNDNDPTEYKRK